ncbi:ubiquitinactivating enzyme E1 1, putative [Acanthamoeba castellanii str. Neff]|uniref:E1 ubiquitin-activating enzyme n=1 Tax=Acanthamoeba castellanii (strain ATCC 30010 / Neff) TaxID=1257118 RepID=L8GPA4_ACACF|nr:ubiquitinactivating enzyme E1 1, putative [Acanthamoeba castellanii str. Neff]ELR14473.1 ubiquitinactivating enzyme E1 1, putative [Acanthamoeba castellanii str. Neff]
MEVEQTSTIERPTTNIDEGLYSRQLYVLNHADMLKITATDVLIVGLKGLGVEIAKNLVLAGVRALLPPWPCYRCSLADPHPQNVGHCFLRESDVGRARAEACVDRLAELNSYVSVSLLSRPLNAQTVSSFSVVVVTEAGWGQKLEVGEWCHERGVAFVGAEARGVFGSVFCDFGEAHTVLDPNGEPPFQQMIASVTRDKPGVVTILDDRRLQLETGDFVKFTEVRGMTQLNDAPPRPITVLGPYTFSIEDTTGYDEYLSGGYVVEVKPPKTLRFLSLQESLKQPTWTDADFGKLERPPQLHLGFHALALWTERHGGSYPLPYHHEHALEVVELAKELNASAKLVETVDEKLISLLAYGSRGEISPMVSFIGGVVAQEVLKACSGKFTPIHQWLYFDAVEALPTDLTPAHFQPEGTRYDGQVAVLGREVQRRLEAQRYFLVGSGAIGCEVLKIWASMGLGAGSGAIHVTDMDMIEKSNLNRQFLFRPKDVGRLKSEAAAEAVRGMNGAINVRAYSARVGPETENVFDENFYESLTGVCNALDNVEARMYMDSQCIYHRKPMLESGTLGTKGNTQARALLLLLLPPPIALFEHHLTQRLPTCVVVPMLTESYSSSRDPPEKSIPVCTLHHFPNKIEHTIHWSRDLFEGYFKNAADHVNAYLSQPDFLEFLRKQPVVQQVEILNAIHGSLVSERPFTFDQCIAWARTRFEDLFRNNIAQLLYNFPLDTITPSGAPFWSGPKRAPSPLTFNPDDRTHMDFIKSAANLRAANFGLKGSVEEGVFRAALGQVTVPSFVPRKGVKIQTKEDAATKVEQSEGDEEQAARLLAELPAPSTLAGYRVSPLIFEKDDDTNFHIDFIAAASNLRARNYSIAEVDKHTTKGIAGKIMPALVTTTALVAGLVCLELIKLVQGKDKLEDFRNGFVNLALPFFGFSEPIAPPVGTITEGWKWTLWDRFDVKGPSTLRQLIELFESEHKLELSMASCGSTMLYSFFMPKSKLNERMDVEIAQLVETVTKKPLPENKKYLTLEVVCSRLSDGEDVDVPPVRYQFRGL